ncbi:MAG: extracellular solute-binding protein [Candidatus Zambryskibacteria bacterium]|nr:extracellular solute-binding protein [Candidatus Zambryskibacteria bacterium]
MSKFQIILLSVFGIFIVVGVAVFSLYRGSSTGSVTVTVWGDISTYDFNLLSNASTLKQDQNLRVNYVEKSSETIETEFTEALARGTGPDLIIITQDKFLKNKPKLVPIPYASISERNFKTTFVEEGELFLDRNGIYALPLFLDPLVLYYNRDRLSSAGQAQPIAYWDEIYEAASNLSKRDAAGNLVTSVMALGEARNIPNAKSILSLLLLQAGTSITKFIGPDLRSQVFAKSGLPISPGESAFDFYTQFSNPTRSYYSWNRSLIDAQTHFTSGDSAYYLGFASELRVLKNKNPTLNFGISTVPQSRVSGKTITFGRLRAVAISRGSRNPNAAVSLAMKLVSKEIALSLSGVLSLPPARRDLLSTRPADPALSVFYDAALQSRGWLDPDAQATDAIFREAVESITSGRARTSEAVSKIDREIDALIQ